MRLVDMNGSPMYMCFAEVAEINHLGDILVSQILGNGFWV
jgi:hypothetical protein